MKLRLSRQPLATPLSVRRGFVMRHVHGPIEREGYLAEHAPLKEPSASFHPEEWRTRRACAHKLQVLSIRHLVLGDAELACFDSARLKFVVPTKLAGFALPHLR